MDTRPICERCGRPIVYSGWGRPPTRFCSRECKEAYRSAAARARTRQERKGRRCERCGRAIPLSRDARARTCSRACTDALQNRKQRAARRAAWLANRAPCTRCGQPIPESRARNAKYCSAECKKKDADARWRAKAPGYNRLYLYGVSQEEFDARLAEQGGVCGICRTPEWKGKGNCPHTDHDHVIGQFRGVLCGNCNNGIGMFGEDPARLRAAAAYLEAWQARL